MAERARTKWDYIYYALIVGTILSFAIALLGFVGEHLGWWNDVGEAFMQLGTAAGVVLGATAIVVGSSRSQVEATREAVEGTREAVEGTREAIGSTRSAVESTRDAVESTKGAVDSTRAAVEDNGDKLDDVDHHLVEQTRVLEQIRDRV